VCGVWCGWRDGGCGGRGEGALARPPRVAAPAECRQTIRSPHHATQTYRPSDRWAQRGAAGEARKWLRGGNPGKARRNTPCPRGPVGGKRSPINMWPSRGSGARVWPLRRALSASCTHSNTAPSGVGCGDSPLRGTWPHDRADAWQLVWITWSLRSADSAMARVELTVWSDQDAATREGE